MSTLTPSFRLPLNIEGKAEPEVIEAIGYHDDAITDLQQAIPSLKSQIEALKTSTSATSSTVEDISTTAETIIVNSSTIGMVNDQTGNTVYATQQSDYGAFITLNDASAIAVTLTQGTAITVPWFASLINLGTGAATLTPATGLINGNADFVLPGGNAITVAYDGTNFWLEPMSAEPENTPSVLHQWLDSYDSATGIFGQSQPAIADISGLPSALALLAPLVSPAFTGTPTAPTASPGTDDTQISTTGYADAAVLVEKTRAEAAEGLLAPIASPTFTGVITQPDATVLTAATTTATATAGSGALPAAPQLFLSVTINSVAYKIALYLP